ncbi:unnamed protein product [Amoebophrya sp. A25]|nr:unnamed protein product [Amoebophrya sp. A25]|eukprot:GSA25T00014450001.1
MKDKMWPFSRKKENKDGENKPWRARFNESGMDMYYNKLGGHVGRRKKCEIHLQTCYPRHLRQRANFRSRRSCSLEVDLQRVK